jgi:hypothetical protein
MKQSLSLIAGLMLSMPAFAHAQRQSDAAVLARAIDHLAEILRAEENLPSGTIRVDERVLLVGKVALKSGDSIPTYGFANLRDSTTRLAILRRLNALSGDFEHARTCVAGNPRSCRLKDAVLIVGVSEPSYSDSTAEVVVAAQWQSNLVKMPVGWGRFAMRLVGDGNDWRVLSTRTLQIQ